MECLSSFKGLPQQFSIALCKMGGGAKVTIGTEAKIFSIVMASTGQVTKTLTHIFLINYCFL